MLFLVPAVLKYRPISPSHSDKNVFPYPIILVQEDTVIYLSVWYNGSVVRECVLPNGMSYPSPGLFRRPAPGT